MATRIKKLARIKKYSFPTSTFWIFPILGKGAVATFFVPFQGLLGTPASFLDLPASITCRHRAHREPTRDSRGLDGFIYDRQCRLAPSISREPVWASIESQKRA